jgi:hypothetical protein
VRVRACVRACGFRRGVGVRESLLGPCSLQLMVALDVSKNMRNSLPPLHPSTSLSISFSLVLPLCLWGIAHSSLQKRHQVRSA